MSEELQIETKNYILKALKKAQDNAGGAKAWCHRDPVLWCKVALHVMEKPSSAYQFYEKDKICTKNVYYDIQKEIFEDPESQIIRNQWASEIACIQFLGIDTFKKSQEDYSKSVEEGNITIDGNELFKQAKTMQAFNDIHSKLTGNNVQKHVVQHVVSQEDYEDKAKKLRDKIKAKQAKQAQVEAIDGVMEVN